MKRSGWCQDGRHTALLFWWSIWTPVESASQELKTHAQKRRISIIVWDVTWQMSTLEVYAALRGPIQNITLLMLHYRRSSWKGEGSKQRRGGGGGRVCCMIAVKAGMGIYAITWASAYFFIVYSFASVCCRTGDTDKNGWNVKIWTFLFYPFRRIGRLFCSCRKPL